MQTIQLFNWKLNSIQNILKTIYHQGYDTILINPIQTIKIENKSHWYLSYQPTSFTIGNEYGTKEDLINLCQEANKYHLDIHVEILSNTLPSLNNFNFTLNPDADYMLLMNPNYHKENFIKDYENRFEAINYSLGIPTLNYFNPDINNIVFQYLVELHQCGVKGFNFCGAKHIGLPNDKVFFFQDIKEFIHDNHLYICGDFVGGNKPWRDEFSHYLDLYTTPSNEITDNNKRNLYIENPNIYYHHQHSNLEETYCYLIENNPKVVLYNRNNQDILLTSSSIKTSITKKKIKRK